MNRQSHIFARGDVPELTSGVVHVWRIPTVVDELSEFTNALSSEELARADRFHFEKDRRSFVVSRGALRQTIAFYTGQDAARIQFKVGLQGKPSLAVSGTPALRFNVSHSGEMALLAFSLDQEVGVDVEFKRPDVDFVGLAEMSFSKAERVKVIASESADRAEIFYEIWACKEACIKADGRGLSVPLDHFTVAHCSAGPLWRDIVSEGPGFPTCGLRSRVLDVGHDYAAAVVANAPSWQVLQLEPSFTYQRSQGRIA